MAWVEHEYADMEELVARLACQLKSVCVDAVSQRGRAFLALAGGRTPLPVYRLLAERPFPWTDLVVVPTDERCVPHEHPACNVRALREAFSGTDGLDLLSLTVPDGDPLRSEAHANGMLCAHAEAFDAVLLGMGSDGHTASLFPGAPNLAAALDPAQSNDAMRIDPLPLPAEAPFARVTLTLERLLRTRSLHLLVSGEEKRTVLRRAQRSRDPSRLPVAAVLHAPGALTHTHWSP